MVTIKKDYKKFILIAIVFFIIGLFIGYTCGVITAVKSIARMASGFIDIDKNLIEQAYFQYKNNIGACFPPLE